MNEKRVVFLHCINMTSYSGHEENIHSGGFKFAKENGFGYEVHNFSKVDGRCYGHVEVPKTDKICLERLGALGEPDSLDGVLAVWTAPCRDDKKGREVVGWYQNATLHRSASSPRGKVKRARRFHHPDTGESIELLYRIEADAKDCFCLNPTLRACYFRTGDQGLPGRYPVYYPFDQTKDEASSRRASKLGTRVVAFIKEISAVVSKFRQSRKTVWRGQDQERKKKIEIAAVEYACEHFGSGPKGRGYEIESREDENVGYDLRLTKGGETLCVEVKGRSRDDVVAEFSRNESRVVCEHQQGKFEDGDYRVCIVTDALNENEKQRLHHFRWWQEKRAWIDVDGSRKLDFHPSGATVATLDANWGVQ